MRCIALSWEAIPTGFEPRTPPADYTKLNKSHSAGPYFLLNPREILSTSSALQQGLNEIMWRIHLVQKTFDKCSFPSLPILKSCYGNPVTVEINTLEKNVKDLRKGKAL